jgi:hypothetical protein
MNANPAFYVVLIREGSRCHAMPWDLFNTTDEVSVQSHVYRNFFQYEMPNMYCGSLNSGEIIRMAMGCQAFNIGRALRNESETNCKKNISF